MQRADKNVSSLLSCFKKHHYAEGPKVVQEVRRGLREELAASFAVLR
jgi:hypothetical protein